MEAVSTLCAPIVKGLIRLSLLSTKSAEYDQKDNKGGIKCIVCGLETLTYKGSPRDKRRGPD